jgi:hypothetical protein
MAAEGAEKIDEVVREGQLGNAKSGIFFGEGNKLMHRWTQCGPYPECDDKSQK